MHTDCCLAVMVSGMPLTGFAAHTDRHTGQMMINHTASLRVVLACVCASVCACRAVHACVRARSIPENIAHLKRPQFAARYHAVLRTGTADAGSCRRARTRPAPAGPPCSAYNLWHHGRHHGTANLIRTYIFVGLCVGCEHLTVAVMVMFSHGMRARVRTDVPKFIII